MVEAKNPQVICPIDGKICDSPLQDMLDGSCSRNGLLTESQIKDLVVQTATGSGTPAGSSGEKPEGQV